VTPALPSYLLVTDYIDTDSEHVYCLNYHFGPEISAEGSGQEFTACDSLGNALHIFQFATLNFSVGTSTGHLSRRYSQREESTMGWVKAAGRGPQMFSGLIVPDPVEARRRLSISRFAYGEGGFFSVQCDEVQDLFVFGNARVSTVDLRVESSARVAWIRQARSRILSAAVIDGNLLAIDGLLQLRSAGSARYILADLNQRRLAVYSDDPESTKVCASGARDLDIRHTLGPLQEKTAIAL